VRILSAVCIVVSLSAFAAAQDADAPPYPAPGRLVDVGGCSGPLRVSEIPPAALQQIRAGLPQASAHADEPPRDKLPPDAQRMRTWALGQVGHVAAAVNPFELEEPALVAESIQQAVAPVSRK
jgi:hypothetical protein